VASGVGVVALVVAAALVAYVAREVVRARAAAAKAWATLRDSEARFRLLAADAPDVIYRVRLGARPVVEYVSPSVLALTGRAPEEYVADPSLALRTVHPDDRDAVETHLAVHAAAAHVVRGQGALGAPVIARWTRADGELVWIEHRGRTIVDADGRVVAVEGIARDVTIVHQALEARDEMLAIVSHDLKNPLQAILMSAERLEDDAVRAGDEATRKLAQRLRRSADRMTRLIFDLLDVASIDAGRLCVESAPCAVDALLSDAADAMRTIAAEKGVDLLVVVDADAPPVLADKERVAQVFSNLIGNAVRFTPAGGRVRLMADGAGAFARFTVADDGPGIPPDVAPRIFDRFWRARPTGRGGAGLGLSIAKGVVEAHGGRIWVDQTATRGATIRFTLPATELTPPGRSSRASSTARAAEPEPTSSISP
jgi:PAS domain S-box-containing protein